jgi:two-component sensor histidine kinase
VLERQTAAGMLLVEDEGVGLPGNGVLAPGGTGLGRRIVEALANGMGGRAEYIRKARGTGVAVHFPVEA